MVGGHGAGAPACCVRHSSIAPRGEAVEEETLIRGRRGAYFVNARMALQRARAKSGAWWRRWIGTPRASPPWSGCSSEMRTCARSLTRMSSAARATWFASWPPPTGSNSPATISARTRHFSNTLFNVMRGGIPDRGYAISHADFQAFLGKANHAVAERQAAFLDALDETLLHSRLLDLARAQDDPDLERLAHEYLPLTFSRRHGDPSRPWNIFSIEVKSEHGERILNYQGNWRDIFQNWKRWRSPSPVMSRA